MHGKEENVHMVYKGKRRKMKQKVKREKKEWMEDLAQQAEDAAASHNTRELYNLTKTMAGKNKKQLNTSER